VPTRPAGRLRTPAAARAFRPPRPPRSRAASERPRPRVGRACGPGACALDCGAVYGARAETTAAPADQPVAAAAHASIWDRLTERQSDLLVLGAARLIYRPFA